MGHETYTDKHPAPTGTATDKEGAAGHSFWTALLLPALAGTVLPFWLKPPGFAAVFTGLLYVAPPFTFYQRPGGEVVVSVGSAMIPVLGAYLMQAGDLTRTVYLACMPVVAAMGLWVWISRLISLPDDEKNGRSSLVMLFPFRFSGRIVPLLLCILIYATLTLAIWGRPALNPVALTALLSGPLAFQIIRILWHDPMDRSQLYMARKYAYYVHMIVCLAIIGSSLVPV